MQYGITRSVFTCKHFLEITAETFKSAKIAKRNLIEVLAIEEKLNFLLENYAEYERELIDLAMDYMMFSGYDWSSFIGDMQRVNLKLINLLTTCRLYMDQITHNINSIYGGESEIAQAIKQQKSQEYDNNLGYRVLEALRNYVQHRDLPIHNVSHRTASQENKDGVSIKHTVIPYILTATLKERGGFKASVLKELERLGESVDIRPFVRQYIESISRIHNLLRKSLDTDIVQWDSTVTTILERYKVETGEDILGLVIVALDESNEVIESIQIFEDIIKRRQWLVGKNQLRTRYSLEIASSEVQGRDA